MTGTRTGGFVRGLFIGGEEVGQVLSQGAPVADIILSYAAERRVALIVIGAYSHARPVEMVFGGVTRTLQKEAPVPVLMSR